MTNNTKRVYITHKIPSPAVEMLQEKGYEVVVGSDTGILSTKKLIAVLKKEEKKGCGYDALVTLLTDKVDTKVLDAGVSLEVVANYAIGYDNIDVATATSRGIVVTNAPGNYTDTIAEHTLSYMMTLASRTAEADRFVRKGLFKGWDPMLLIGTDLSKKTLGIIGAGRIGERVVHMAKKGLDMNVIYFDTRANQTIENDCQAKRVGTLDELVSQADVISLHVPLLPTTRHMVDQTFLRKMKKTALLINASRGPVVDENALVLALKNKDIAGAALDVYEFEPKLAKGLVKLENVVLTPHIGSASEHARLEMSRIVAQNIIDVFEGKVPAGNVVA